MQAPAHALRAPCLLPAARCLDCGSASCVPDDAGPCTAAATPSSRARRASHPPSVCCTALFCSPIKLVGTLTIGRPLSLWSAHSSPSTLCPLVCLPASRSGVFASPFPPLQPDQVGWHAHHRLAPVPLLQCLLPHLRKEVSAAVGKAGSSLHAGRRRQRRQQHSSSGVEAARGCSNPAAAVALGLHLPRSCHLHFCALQVG